MPREATTEPTLSQALHMINGDTLTRKIGESKRLQKLLDAGKKPIEVVETIYIGLPVAQTQPRRVQKLDAVLAAEPNARVAVDDIFWAVLNSREFLFNH